MVFGVARTGEVATVDPLPVSSAIVCPRVRPFTLGQLLYLLETEAVIMADLLAVDPFTQPGLDEGKQLAYGLAGRAGGEGRRAEVQRWVVRKEPRYVV